MEAVERLTALKKVYTDMMLNTAKEAASRIMASERKAAQYKYELEFAKGEGVRLLMRLKQMMDSKLREAEATSLNQQKKIEEVEAQLQEAEDIVEGLRNELREVKAELERSKTELERSKTKSMPLVDETGCACPRVPDENTRNSARPITFAQPNLPHEFHVASNVRTKNPSIGSPELPTVRNKENGLYRKGCTYRIHACERNQLDRKSCILGKYNKLKHTSRKEQKLGKDTSIEPAHGTKTSRYLEKNLTADIKVSPTSFVSKRKRAIRRRKSRSPTCGEPADKLVNPNDVLDTDSGENPSKMTPKLSPQKPQPEIQLGCVEVESSEKKAVLVENSDAQNEMSNDQELIEGLLFLRQQPVTAERSGTPHGELDAESNLVNPHGKLDAESNLVNPHGKLDADSNLVNDSELKSSHVTRKYPDPALSDRVFKYMFQRKRKRQTESGSDVNAPLETDTSKRQSTESGSNVNVSLETDILKRQSTESGSNVNVSCGTDNSKRQSEKKQNGDQNPTLQNPSLATGDFEDDMPLAQVARQLLALSEKKCWG